MHDHSDTSAAPSPASTPTPPSRRKALGILVGSGSAALAAGLIWQQRALEHRATAPAVAQPLAEPTDAPYPDMLPPAFWQQVFSRPDGRALSLVEFKGTPLLINFWATWCPPCVKEMPLLERFFHTARKHGWRVLGLASDQPEAIQTFLRSTPVNFDIAIANEAGIALARRLGNTAGGLPFTVVVDHQGLIKTRKMGALQAADLQRWQQQGP